MKRVLFLVVLLLLSSCGTIFRTKTVNLIPSTEGSQKVEVEVVTKNGTINTTLPTKINAPRGKNFLIIKVKENNCYKSSQTVKSPRWNVFVLLNAAAGLFSTTSTTVDYASGSIWSYDDSAVIIVNRKSSCDN